MIIDNFIGSYNDLKAISLSCDFNDEVNDADGVVYPFIFKDIPQDIQDDILLAIEKAIGSPPKESLMFLRMSPKGVNCPHIVHHDKVMGDYSLMLYLNEGEGGTSLVRHIETGISYAPNNEQFAKIIAYDQNNPSQWDITSTAKMKENRGFIFDAGNLHCAEPLGGFGDDQSNSRIVLTCFFS